MKKFNTIEELTAVVGDGYFRDVPQGKVLMHDESLIEVILNKAVIMIINKRKSSTHYCLFDTVTEARTCFNSL